MPKQQADRTVGSVKPGTGSKKSPGPKKSHTGQIIVAAMVAALVVLGIAFYFALPVDAPVSSDTQACAARLYSPYNPKNLDQCIAVCQACGNGVKTTCATSCTLKGAR